MLPIIKSGQKHKVAPVKDISELKINDIVFCKVKSVYYTHLVKAIDKQKGCLIGNNRGKINGWTKKIFGKVIEVL